MFCQFAIGLARIGPTAFFAKGLSVIILSFKFLRSSVFRVADEIF